MKKLRRRLSLTLKGKFGDTLIEEREPTPIQEENDKGFGSKLEEIRTLPNKVSVSSAKYCSNPVLRTSNTSNFSVPVIRNGNCNNMLGIEPSPNPALLDQEKHRIRTRSFREYNMDMKQRKRMSLPGNNYMANDVYSSMGEINKVDAFQNRLQRRASMSELGFGKIESYTKLDRLGEGTYATVYKGRSIVTDSLVALKEIRLEHEEGAPCTAIREISLLKGLKQANIVTLHDIIHTNKSLTLVFEFVDKDLKQYMDDCGNSMSMNNVKLFLFQLLRGLNYCHKRRVLHRDLKPQNLLITEKGELKLADFGLARAKSVPTKTYSNEVVTLWYRPPDVLLGSTDYTTSIDMWGVGCIYYEMACGRPLFPGSTVVDQLMLVFKLLGTPTTSSWPELIDNGDFKDYKFKDYPGEPLVKVAPRLDGDGIHLLSRFLEFDGKKRISADVAMHQKYFKVLGEAIHRLRDDESIFIMPGIKMSKNPGHKYLTFHSDANKSRRQSTLF